MDYQIIHKSFVWNAAKEKENLRRHGVDFATASRAFFDPNRVILTDEVHSSDEERYFCLGIVEGRVLTVRFTLRAGKIRVIGAGYWRKGGKIYEAQKK